MVQTLKYSVFLIFLCHNLQSKAQKEKTTLKTIIVETTTEEVTIITDIPQSDVQLAVNHDVGKYTTMVFNYINKQYETKIRYERCFEDYTKCLITQSVATPICAVNDPYEIPDGFVTYNSYCDAYFDNCLRQMRFWRILGPGKCFFQGSYFTIHRTRKGLGYQPNVFNNTYLKQ